ncbi:Metallo-beta-lactamase family protein [Rubellimicrobium mesophilum DSM 19309]|uniref:Metallo-beta-lactamase family protein n=1 Tax=Rubellimicrobium mesophilum DSM 19309 TaxID=442562 RepID=A0A017HQS2_9RHOB|nr:MBL fold metallo-hydrolase [Rubellimicrobium mesophilum]EYD76665.1 Metallo-beta-lactamase family protein [Rubellimicrobium mesophilum DSM 19309]
MEIVEPDLGRVVAPNPSPLTAEGTNTWLLGTSEVAVIDPGPDDAGHLEAVLAALDGRPVVAILVTHAHLDHSALAPALSVRTGAPVLAFGDARAGWRPVPEAVGGGRGVDWGFRPDRLLRDGEEVGGHGWRLRAWHTPGHMGNHLCLDDGRRLFTGDHAMGFATSLVSPPEGDMGDYVDSLDRLIGLGPRMLLPGHGAMVEHGPERLRALREHRRQREKEIVEALGIGPATVGEIAARLYAGLAVGLLRAAERNVLAHLIDLSRRGVVAPVGALSRVAAFRRV